MANSVSVRLDGVDGFLSKARALIPRVRENTRQAVHLSLLLIESDAKAFCPVDTGRLRASIHAEPDANGLGGTVSTNVSYAGAQEFGTRYMKAQPYLVPAYEKNRLAFLANLKAATKLF